MPDACQGIAVLMTRPRGMRFGDLPTVGLHFDQRFVHLVGSLLQARADGVPKERVFERKIKAVDEDGVIDAVAMAQDGVKGVDAAGKEGNGPARSVRGIGGRQTVAADTGDPERRVPAVEDGLKTRDRLHHRRRQVAFGDHIRPQIHRGGQ